MSTYLFRDNETAAARLEIVSEIFDPPSRSFIEICGPPVPELALDLGCGPGYTTRLLVEALRPLRTIGLDASARFLERARYAMPVGVEFQEHDVSEPLPGADVVYSRFLLPHLKDPLPVVASWVASLKPGGRMLLDEVEWIETRDSLFRRYLGVVRDRLRARGQKLEVGRDLSSARPEGARIVMSRLVRLAPDPARVAQMFAANARAWRDEAPPGLDGELLEGDRDQIVWGLRQIAYERRAR
jgi:trans-aconitate 2-methyltransferase